MKLFIFIAFTFIISQTTFSQTISQYLISPAGTEFTTSSVFGSFSTGQITTATFTSQSLIITQGYQSGTVVEEPITGIEHLVDISKKLIVYPNPAENFIHFEIPQNIGDEFNIQAFDIHGKEVLGLDNKIYFRQQAIDIAQLSIGNYVFKIISGDKKYFGLVRVIKIK